MSYLFLTFFLTKKIHVVKCSRVQSPEERFSRRVWYNLTSSEKLFEYVGFFPLALSISRILLKFNRAAACTDKLFPFRGIQHSRVVEQLLRGKREAKTIQNMIGNLKLIS